MALVMGNTPIGTYDLLVADYKTGKVDFSGVSSVNLDEYYPISPDNKKNYRGSLSIVG